MRTPATEKNKALINSDSVSAAPAFLLCAATLVMLILDLMIPAMSEYQYMVYPLIVKCTGLAGLVSAALCMKYLINDEHIKPDAGNLCFVLFLIFAAISTCINGFSRDVLLGVKYRYIGISSSGITMFTSK